MLWWAAAAAVWDTWEQHTLAAEPGEGVAAPDGSHEPVEVLTQGGQPLLKSQPLLHCLSQVLLAAAGPASVAAAVGALSETLAAAAAAAAAASAAAVTVS